VFTLAVYTGSYLIFRVSHVEIWEQDRNAYVILPENRVPLYYLWRPLTYADAAVTDMRFHIGPHRQ
jgi:hypothetical protein